MGKVLEVFATRIKLYPHKLKKSRWFYEIILLFVGNNITVWLYPIKKDERLIQIGHMGYKNSPTN
jgi:hypothetical protein